MKSRIIYITIFSLSSIFSLQAQFRVGVQTGVNLGSFTLPDNFSSNATRKINTGFTIGGIGEFALSNTLFLLTEPNYVQKGFKTEITDATGTAKSTESINYLDIPVFVKVKFLVSDFQPFIQAGPNFGFLLNASEDAILPNGQSLPSLNTKTNYKSYDVSIDFGAGLEYRMQPTISIYSSFRYSLGITNVYDFPSGSGETRDIRIYIGALINFN